MVNHALGRWALALAWAGLACGISVSASQAPAAAGQSPGRSNEVGIPIQDKTVQAACGSCHRSDDKQQMSRISFRRTTPEGWQETIKRMVALNGLKIEPAAARDVVKYLSDHLGLAPEEARPAAYEVERRLGDDAYKSDNLEGVCNACHSLGRVIAQRRTRGEWEGLVAMHRGWYPLVDRQVFRRMGPAPTGRDAEGRPPDTRHPMDKAIDHLSAAFPLETAEWAAWSAAMRPARIGGQWALTGHEPGQGDVYGRVVLTPVPNTDDEFTSDITYTYARSGQQVKRTGRVVIYTGYQWRGRSSVGGDDSTAAKEVMLVDRDWRGIDGRWFHGGYDETGIDVQLRRVGGDTAILGVDRSGLRQGATQTVKIFVANPPSALQARDVDLGPGVTVTSASLAGDVITAGVAIASTATVGPRDVVIGGVVKPAALVVYDKVDALRVVPDWSMARTGGVSYPKMFTQFEAWAYQNGPDKKPGTDDDLRVGMVDAVWSLEEYTATFEDDDVNFVGSIDPESGLFTPNVEGPNPKRVGQRNNVGDVWVVATYRSPSEASAPPLRGRAHLLVTVPLYMRFDFSVTP
ncbi:MAG TPA: quinohemoprotein amine dehydrogenase subunit alpha [Vicinamibacterales bacterium]|nr:quinohemoprotein amine dehydrogenase subunit alpha [Vicinamibacterales bacterium]